METINAAQAAEILGIQIEPVREAARNGLYGAHKKGGQWRFDRALVEAAANPQSGPVEAPRDRAAQLDAAALFVVFDQFEKAIKAGKAQARHGVLEAMEPGDRVAVTLPSGKRIGKVTMTDPKPRLGFEVTDLKAFTEWASRHHPAALELKHVVQPWFMDPKNLAALVKEHDGEIPPGVTEYEKQSTPYPKAVLDVDERIAFLAAYRAGELHAPVLAEIEGL